MFNTAEIRRVLVSAAGALVLSITCITAAVGPVKAAVLPMMV